jgi:hypothetical protein
MVMNYHIVHDYCVPRYLSTGAEIFLLNTCATLVSLACGWLDKSCPGRAVAEVLQARKGWNRPTIDEPGVISSAAALRHERSAPASLIILESTIYWTISGSTRR